MKGKGEGEGEGRDKLRQEGAVNPEALLRLERDECIIVCLYDIEAGTQQ